jgi:hypothetical protein
MADIYVRNPDGLDADNGSTWDLAKATLTGAAAIDAAGDNIYLSQAHSESTPSALTLNFAGTVGNPIKILTVDDSAFPPTTLSSTRATVATTGTSAISIQNSLYAEGVRFVAGSGTGAVSITIGSDGANQRYDNCSFELGSTSTSGRIGFGPSSVNNRALAILKDCNFKFAALQGLAYNGNGKVEIIGGQIDPTSTNQSSLIPYANHTVDFRIKNFNIQNITTSATLVTSPTGNGRIDFINCKLPTTWTGQLATGIANSGLRVSMYNCDSGTQNYRLWIETYAGSITSNTAIVKTGGASDGTTSLSWKLTSSANTKEIGATLTTDDISVWLDTVGSSKTISVDIIHDSVTALTNAEVWLEIDYLGSSSEPLGSSLSNRRVDILTTAASQPSSSATWSGSFTNPNKQKLELTFTPNMKGFVYARVCLAKPSYTIYVDPKPTVT